MPLHLIKLSVGTDSIEDLEDWIQLKLKEKKKRGEKKPERIHTTRMVPKRAEEILDGGSIYWVIKGVIQALEDQDVRTCVARVLQLLRIVDRGAQFEQQPARVLGDRGGEFVVVHRVLVSAASGRRAWWRASRPSAAASRRRDRRG